MLQFWQITRFKGQCSKCIESFLFNKSQSIKNTFRLFVTVSLINKCFLTNKIRPSAERQFWCLLQKCDAKQNKTKQNKYSSDKISIFIGFFHCCCILILPWLTLNFKFLLKNLVAALKSQHFRLENKLIFIMNVNSSFLRINLFTMFYERQREHNNSKQLILSLICFQVRYNVDR